MPSTLTFPGVYVEEIPSGVRTITGVATSITAFVGRALRGPVDKPIVINSNADFERLFGGLWVDSTLGYAVADFFANGGVQAIIVRVFNPETGQNAVAGVAQLDVGTLTLEAVNAGRWGRSLRATIDQDGIFQEVADSMGLAVGDLFNLTISEVDADQNLVRSEKFSNLSVKESSRRIDRVLKDDSQLVRWRGAFPANPAAVAPAKDAATDGAAAYLDAKKKFTDSANKMPGLEQKLVDAEAKLAAAQAAVPPDAAAVTAATQARDAAKQARDDEKTIFDAAKTAFDQAKQTFDALITGGSDGLTLDEPSFTGSAKSGLFALDQADLFNLLCIPPYEHGGEIDEVLISKAAAYCETKRAMFIVDPPAAWDTVQEVLDGLPDVGTSSKNAALFFPRVVQPNPLRENKLQEFVPCGVVAGVFARTDAQRGVWKAPAGLDATLVGVSQLTIALTNPENGQLNPLGVNCLRQLPAAGRVVWGSRTLQGNDRLGSEWKYVPVRRTALFIEESLYRGLQWVVFEPNDEPLWAQIRLNVGAFMNSLFRQGAFQGQSPREAYFVKCDKDTTTQNDIDRGIVNILVGFAPLKPAEFVVIKLQQIAGQIQT
ncbi:MAG TPA: phage tail sheath C-terminal domain-containing protein [Pyrinomonadaceae bacterium]|nr:phage tail sheath C-terminal domain-containing protein [Pyrinomonadaceae bacterium]